VPSQPEQDARDAAQARLQRWSRVEIIIVTCTAVIVAAAVILGMFIIPLRNTVDSDHCIARATAVAVAEYQAAVAKVQAIPIGPERAFATPLINNSVADLRRATAQC
jgi:hypothetical protein